MGISTTPHLTKPLAARSFLLRSPFCRDIIGSGSTSSKPGPPVQAVRGAKRTRTSSWSDDHRTTKRRKATLLQSPSKENNDREASSYRAGSHDSLRAQCESSYSTKPSDSDAGDINMVDVNDQVLALLHPNSPSPSPDDSDNTTSQSLSSSSWDQLDELDMYPGLLYKPKPSPKLNPKKLKQPRASPRPKTPLRYALLETDIPAPDLRAAFEAHIAREIADEDEDGFPKPLRRIGAWGVRPCAKRSGVKITPTPRRRGGAPPPALSRALHTYRADAWLRRRWRGANTDLALSSILEDEFLERRKKAVKACASTLVEYDMETQVVSKGTPAGPRDPAVERPSFLRHGGTSKYTARAAPEEGEEVDRISEAGGSTRGPMWRKYRQQFKDTAKVQGRPASPDDASVEHWLVQKGRCLVLDRV